MSAPALHCHGMDCCWSCFHGKPTHPAKPSDPDCERDGCEPDTTIPAPVTLDFDDAMARSVDQRTFSNGTEFDIWSGRWCGTCVHDVNGDCPLVSVALLERKPAEWVEQPRDQYPQDAYHCTAHQREGEPK